MPNHRRRLFFRPREIVHGPVPAVDVPPAEVFLGDIVAHGVADHRRAGNEQLRNVADHYREVTEHGLRGADPHHAAEQHVDHRDGAELFRVHRAPQVRGQEGAPSTGHARPAGLDVPVQLQ